MDTEDILRKVSIENGYPLDKLKQSLSRTYEEYRKDSKMRFFFDNFKPKKGDVVLDVGCFVGGYDAILAERYPDVMFIGFDTNRIYVEGANAVSARKNCKFYHKDIFKANIRPGSVDHIFFLEVLEHVENPKGLLEHFHRLLRKGGKLYLSTPAALGITNILYNIKRHSIKYIEKEKPGVGAEADHLYIWDKLTLYRLLFRSGFHKPLLTVSRKYSIFQGQSLCFIVEKA